MPKNRALHFLAAVILLAGVLPAAASENPATSSHLQPQLAQLAALAPNQIVSVIVQKGTHDSSVEALATQLGGKITSDLWLINAFAAEIKVDRLPQLALAPGVKWI